MIQTDILKQEEKAALALRSLYRSYGYLPFKMSKFEEYEYYIRNKDFLVSDRFITFNDTNGKLMALKPDVTLSIIKNSQDAPGCKQKVCYNENIYRVSDSTRQYKELLQAGLECIGDVDLYDIFEVLSLAAGSLELIHKDYMLQISHLGVLEAVLDAVSPEPDFRREATAYIAQKNAHDLARLCKDRGLDEHAAQLLKRFIGAYGQRDQVLRQLEELCGGLAGDPLEELRRLSRLLDTIPGNERILFDFSVVNDMNYYNGIVFRGFLSGISGGVLAGGQYDKLMRKMDRRSGAIGFAVYLDLLEQLPSPGKSHDVDVLLIYEAGTDPLRIREAVAGFTAQGLTVSAQRSVPEKLRAREIRRLRKDGSLC